MTHTDQINSALRRIADAARVNRVNLDAELGELKALAADYERQREEIERLKRQHLIFRNMCIDQFRNRGVLLEEARQLVDELVQEPLKSPS